MANWDGKPKSENGVNGGVEFQPNDAVVAEDINACFNNAFYAKDFANHLADAPDITEVDGGGTPSVSIVNGATKLANDGSTIQYKKFKFSNLKGKGISSITKKSTSGLVDTYTITYTDNTTFDYNITNGATGAAAGFGNVSATVDATVGTPSVNVSTSGGNTAKNFAFAFHNLKGETGATGSAALEYSSVRNVTTVPKISDTFTLTDSFNRTPVSGDYVNIICRNTNSGETYTLVCRVTSYSNGTATLTIVSLTNTMGAKGDKGDAATVNGSTSNTITFSLSGTTLSITVG